MRLCHANANSARSKAPTPTGMMRKLQDMLLTTTTSGSIPAGGWNIPVTCIATIARPTATAAAHGAGPHILATTRPTRVESKWPPISARGCAGPALGEPNTVTIEVANGIATNGKAVRIENASMRPIAMAPPAAPAKMAKDRGQSDIRDDGALSKFSVG